MTFALPTPCTSVHVSDCLNQRHWTLGTCMWGRAVLHCPQETCHRVIASASAHRELIYSRGDTPSPRTWMVSVRRLYTIMSPITNHTTITCDALEQLQSQNNTIQLVAAIFAIAYGIPLIFALWLQWKTFVAARSQSDQGTLGIDTT